MDYYSGISEGYDELYGKEQTEKLALISKNLKLSEKNSLLDVGCGTGISTEFWPCISKTGIDPSKGLIEKAKARNPTTNYVIGKAEKLPFADNSFDIVISITAIQNFSDVKKSLKEMKRVGRHTFAFSVLKKSPKIEEIKDTIKKFFHVSTHLVEDKDEIFIIKKE